MSCGCCSTPLSKRPTCCQSTKCCSEEIKRASLGKGQSHQSPRWMPSGPDGGSCITHYTRLAKQGPRQGDVDAQHVMLHAARICIAQHVLDISSVTCSLVDSQLTSPIVTAATCGSICIRLLATSAAYLPVLNVVTADRQVPCKSELTLVGLQPDPQGLYRAQRST